MHVYSRDDLAYLINMPSKKNPAAVALGRLGGLKGGKARAAKLSAKRRSEIGRMASAARMKKISPRRRKEIARKAILARWSKHK
jgi:hypothetical protein